MPWGLYLSAFLVGLAGIGHCVAMCTAPCAAAERVCFSSNTRYPKWRRMLSLHAGRLLGYTLVGGLASASMDYTRGMAAHVEQLRPLWITAQVALLVFGGFLFATGRLPWHIPLFDRVIAPLRRAGGSRLSRLPKGHTTAGLLGSFWALLPCAQLYAGVLIASLAPRPIYGAATMMFFAVPGTAALIAGPTLWTWWRRAKPIGLVVPHCRFTRGAVAVSVVQVSHRPQLPVDSYPDRSVRLVGGALVLAGAWMLWGPKPTGGLWCV